MPKLRNEGFLQMALLLGFYHDVQVVSAFAKLKDLNQSPVYDIGKIPIT